MDSQPIRRVFKRILPPIVLLLASPHAIAATGGGAVQPGIPIDAVIDAIQTRSVHRRHVDWDRALPELRDRLGKAKTDQDVMRAFVSLFERMGDVHSQLIHRGQSYAHYEGVDAQAAERLQPLLAAARSQAGQVEGKVVGKRYAYLRVPSMQVFGQAPIDQSAQQLQDEVCRLSERRPRGWIVDLRLNSGGNMVPMLAGLAPLLGTGVVGAATDADERPIFHWRISDHDLWIADQRMTHVPRPCRADLSRTPVVVLLSEITASSGQATAIAFKHRPRTWSIGQPTAKGYTTGNEWIPLGDDLVLNLSTSYMADRKGMTYREQVLPDRTVQGDDRFDVPAEDAKVQAAVLWLSQARR